VLERCRHYPKDRKNKEKNCTDQTYVKNSPFTNTIQGEIPFSQD